MFGEDNNMKIIELERLHEVLSFEEILEESELTNEEVVAVLYDLGYIKMPPYLVEEETEQ